MNSDNLIIYSVLIILIMVGSWSLFIVMSPQENMAGRAFYFTEEGELGITRPGQDLPPELTSINVRTWGALVATFKYQQSQVVDIWTKRCL
jgi:hypothetical protein